MAKRERKDNKAEAKCNSKYGSQDKVRDHKRGGVR